MPEQPHDPPQECFSVKQAAKMLGLSPKHIRRAMMSGALAFSDFNNGVGKRPTYRIHRSDIDKYRKSCKPNVGPSKDHLKALRAKFYPELVGASPT